MAGTLTPVQSNPKVTAGLCWLGWVFDFYDLILIAFVIHAIEADLMIDASMTPWMIGVGLGASGLGGILFGGLADRFGRKRTLTWTILLFSFGMLATSFSQTAWQFFLFRAITGLGLGGEWAIGHALVAESVPAQSRARWSAFLQSGEPVGVALAAVVGFLIAPEVGWRTVFLCSSLTALLALVFRRYLPESPLWLQAPYKDTRTRIKEAGPFLKAHWRIMALALVLAIFKLGTYWTCYTWLPQFIQQSFGFAMKKSTLWLLCGQLGQFLGMFAFGYVADWVGRRWAFTAFSTLTAMALLPLALFWHDLWGHALFWPLMFLLGFGSGCTAGFGALLSELFPTAQRTFAMGTTYNLARGVQVFAPVLVAMAVAEGGITGGLLVPTSLAIATALWVWTLPERKGEALQ